MPNITSSHHQYFKHIDGLRALAVLSVIIYHLDNKLLPGGFVGVDIFFVISGFLISSHIYKELSVGKFSLSKFYEKRIRRIVPALFFVIAVVSVLSQFILLPWDAERVAESGLWSLFSAGNYYFYFYLDQSYFAESSETKPLLHLWSLGVEEQFYLLWPLIVIWVGLARKTLLFFLVFLISVVSITSAEFAFSENPSGTYFLLQYRSGELLLGALLALIAESKKLKGIRVYYWEALSVTGIGLIAFSLFAFSKNIVFPGYSVLMPCIGAGLLIISGAFCRTLISKILSFKLFVFIGLLSYSAYLWHWPIFAFYRYTNPEVSFMSGIVLLTLTGLISYLSYKFVEVPFRHKGLARRKIYTCYFLLPAVMLSVLFLSAMKLDGYGVRAFSTTYSSKLNDVREKLQPSYEIDYICLPKVLTSEHLDSERCVVNKNSDSPLTTLLWGDSNASHYVGTLEVFADYHDYKFKNLTVNSCPPILDMQRNFSSAKRYDDCFQSSQVVKKTIMDYDTIIISAKWNAYQNFSSGEYLPNFEKMVQELTDKYHKKVILIGKAPTFWSYIKDCEEKKISLPFMNCEIESVRIDDDIVAANNFLKNIASKSGLLTYIDFNSFLCTSGICNIRSSDGELLYRDYTHFSYKGAKHLGLLIKENGSVPYIN